MQTNSDTQTPQHEPVQQKSRWWLWGVIIVLIILVVILLLMLIGGYGCTSTTTEQGNTTEQMRKDSIAKAERELFIRDSIAIVEREMYVRDSIASIKAMASLELVQTWSKIPGDAGEYTIPYTLVSPHEELIVAAVSNNQEWINIDNVDIDNTTIHFSTTENILTDDRAGSITISYGEKEYIYVVVQTINNVFDASPTGTIDGHEYVDLGLSVKWATCNVGANNPEESGDYFAWGETKTKEIYTVDTHDKSLREIDFFNSDIDGDVDHDAATANWGGRWRMPTNKEVDELVKKCDWEVTKINGINGYKVTSKANGNSIFLPFGGARDKSLLGYNVAGGYWSASRNITVCGYALYINSKEVKTTFIDPASGFTVRAVIK